VLNPWYSQEKLGGKFLGHLVDLKAKAGGEKSTPEKRESPEGVYGADPQGPRDKAKATRVYWKSSEYRSEPTTESTK
jgi:hypothetical protein